jgi:ribosome-binding protein aMBF1 (putative translation factor)
LPPGDEDLSLREEVKRISGALLEVLRQLLVEESARSPSKEPRKEIKKMPGEKMERQRQVAAIKKGAKSLNGGQSYLLQGLWACRQAAGLTQRQVAQMMGSSQTTVRKLERLSRGAYPKTIQRLCQVLGVTPDDLLCGDSNEREEEAHR